MQTPTTSPFADSSHYAGQIGQQLSLVLIIGLISLSVFVSGTNAQEEAAVVTPDTSQAERTPVEESTAEAQETSDIELGQADEYVDKNVRLKFRVASAKLVEGHKICFLNSQADHREPSNVSVVIKTGEVLDLFTAADIPNPAAHFDGKTIQVTGQVQLHKDRPQILVTKVEQIKILEEESSAVLGRASETEAAP